MIERAAARVGATEGQVWSLLVGLVVASVLALTGIPPAMRDHIAAAPAPALRPARVAAQLPRSSPTTTVPLPAPGAIAGPVVTAPVVTAPVVTPSVEEAPPPAPFGAVSVLATTDGGGAGITVDGAGRVVVALDDGQVVALDRTGTRVRSIPSQGRLPSLAALPDGSVVAADAAGARVLRIDPASGATRVLATIPDVPSCGLAAGAAQCEPGLQGHKPDVRGVTATADGTVFVADAAQATIWRIAPGRHAEPWYQSAQLAAGEGATALDVAPDGSIVVAIATDLSERSVLSSTVRRILPGDDGRAASSQTVADLGRGQRPVGILAGDDGRLFVLVAESSSLLVLEADGAGAGRIDNLTGARSLGGWLDGDLLVTSASGEVRRVVVRR